MLRSIFELPFSANAAGFLLQMRELVAEYKKLMADKSVLFYELRVKSLRYRFDALKGCKKNFRFNEKEESEYTDFVIEFNNIKSVNIVEFDSTNDLETGLLD